MRAVRYSGAGNTFLLADNRENTLSLCQFMPHLHNVDGIIFVEKSAIADVFMRIFNKDGSEAEMCGNGLRCLIHFLKSLGMDRQTYQIDTLAGVHHGWFEGEEVCFLLPPPTQLNLNLDRDLHFLNTGVPHVVQFVDSIEKIQVFELGRQLRYAPQFAPNGTNANFVERKKDGSLTIRTYERGVEAETLACGTGAVASALISHKIFNILSPIQIYVRSGEKLKVFFNEDWSKVSLQGPVKKESDFFIVH